MADSESISTYATAAATIVGAVVIAPTMIAKDLVTKTTSNIWENLREHYYQLTTSNNNSYNQPLIEYATEDGWNIIDIIGNSSNT